MRRAARACAVAVAVAALAGCGGGSRAGIVAPASVASDMVPASVAGGLLLREFTPARARFAKAGESSLVADGRVWEIRRGQTLVGTLQVSTVKPEVSVTDASDRRDIVSGVMTGISYETVSVGETNVIVSTASDKSLYLWFGRNLFEVLQVKSTKVDPDEVAAELIEFQQATGVLRRGAR